MTSTDQDTFSYEQPRHRSTGRNLFIYDLADRDTVLGGLWVAPGVTNTNLYSMVDVLCTFTDSFSLQDDNQCMLERNGQQLIPGNYYIVTNGSITVTSEVPLVRTLYVPSGTWEESFCFSVRDRDRRCIISGMPGVIDGIGFWKTYEAAHIFPLAYEGHWNECGYGRWITVPPAPESDGSINSVQNGILLSLDIHVLFDCYDFSINPDDGYKIVCFNPVANQRIANRQLDQQLLDDPLRPVDELLRWHFRQAILTNVKGAGECVYDEDFLPDPVMPGKVMSDRMPEE